jgi:biotin operon repressor
MVDQAVWKELQQLRKRGPITPVHGSPKGHKPVSSSVVMTPKFNENGERQNLTEDEKKNV